MKNITEILKTIKGFKLNQVQAECGISGSSWTKYYKKESKGKTIPNEVFEKIAVGLNSVIEKIEAEQELDRFFTKTILKTNREEVLQMTVLTLKELEKYTQIKLKETREVQNPSENVPTSVQNSTAKTSSKSDSDLDRVRRYIPRKTRS